MKKSFFVNFRSGEVARITVETFLEYVNNDNQSQTLTEIESTLDPCEKALAKKNSLIKVRGKRDGQMVYIIVEKIVRESLIAVINKRSEIGILEENRQLFALPGKKLSHLIGCVVIAKFAKDCGLRHLKSFTSTNLRKYLATTLQVKNFIIYKINDRKSFFFVKEGLCLSGQSRMTHLIARSLENN